MTSLVLPKSLEEKLDTPVQVIQHALPRDLDPRARTRKLEEIHEQVSALTGRTYAPGPLRELVQNAYTHVRSERPVQVDLFIPQNELLAYRCVDGGSYFSDPSIKNIWESRKDPPASPHRKQGHYLGHVLVYLFTDDIFVDTQEPAIYATQRPQNP